jgi:hypothetical protein
MRSDMWSTTRFLSEQLNTEAAIDLSKESKSVDAQPEEKQPAKSTSKSSFEADYKQQEALAWNDTVADITMILANHDIVMSTDFVDEIRQDLNSANDYFDIIKKMVKNNLLNQRNFDKLMGLGDLLGTSAYYVVEFSTNKLLTQSRFDFIYAQMACVLRHRDKEDYYLDSLEESLMRVIKRKNKRKAAVIDDGQIEAQSDNAEERVQRPRL